MPEKTFEGYRNYSIKVLLGMVGELMLNPPGDIGYLRANYDKLLHITGTFTVLSLLSVWLPGLGAFAIVLVLQSAKTTWNYISNKNYNPIGDLISNIIGYSLFALSN